MDFLAEHPAEYPAGHDAHYLTVTAQAFGWNTTWNEDAALTMHCGPWSVRAQFTPSGAYVIAVAHGPDQPARHLSMPQALEILETRGAPLLPS
jgi:hypothetical protein